jgi:hypothetical protein
MEGPEAGVTTPVFEDVAVLGRVEVEVVAGVAMPVADQCPVDGEGGLVGIRALTWTPVRKDAFPAMTLSEEWAVDVAAARRAVLAASVAREDVEAALAVRGQRIWDSPPARLSAPTIRRCAVADMLCGQWWATGDGVPASVAGDTAVPGSCVSPACTQTQFPRVHELCCKWVHVFLRKIDATAMARHRFACALAAIWDTTLLVSLLAGGPSTPSLVWDRFKALESVLTGFIGAPPTAWQASDSLDGVGFLSLVVSGARAAVEVTQDVHATEADWRTADRVLAWWLLLRCDVDVFEYLTGCPCDPVAAKPLASALLWTGGVPMYEGFLHIFERTRWCADGRVFRNSAWVLTPELDACSYRARCMVAYCGIASSVATGRVAEVARRLPALRVKHCFEVVWEDLEVLVASDGAFGPLATLASTSNDAEPGAWQHLSNAALVLAANTVVSKCVHGVRAPGDLVPEVGRERLRQWILAFVSNVRGLVFSGPGRRVDRHKKRRVSG